MLIIALFQLMGFIV